MTKCIIDDDRLMTDWNWEKNTSLSPYTLSKGSHKKVWWICSKGHEWEATVFHRSNGTGCPICSGHKVLSGYNDLATTNHRLASEWNYSKNDGLLPSSFTKSSNKSVWWICDKKHEWKASINSRNSGNGCPYCSNQMVLTGYNDLATTNPELVHEWNYRKNDGVTPESITAGSSKKIWWQCKYGHEWQATIAHRKKGVGCPICAGQKILIGYNDLATIKPEIASEWNYEKNGNYTPQMFTSNSSKKVWWICSKGHE